MSARIGLVTLAKAAETDRFCHDRAHAAVFVCLSDPERVAYRAYSLSRASAHEFLTPHLFARGFQAALHGHMQGLPKGDPLQMPGVFLVDREGIVRYAHRHHDAADNPPIAEILATLRAL